MTFKEIQDELVLLRFGENRRSNVKRWINHRYAWVWGAFEWPFKKIGPSSLSVTSGDSTPAMPSDFGRLLDLWDDNGRRLRELSPQAFADGYEGSTSTGRPAECTVVNRQLHLGPTPDQAYTFSLSYERPVTYLASGTTATQGLMANDTDEPLFPDEYHFMLVLGAAATGLKMENDPTWEALEAEFMAMLEAMREDLLPPDHGENLQYGRDILGMDGWL